jgi:hypothetical protein
MSEKALERVLHAIPLALRGSRHYDYLDVAESLKKPAA